MRILFAIASILIFAGHAHSATWEAIPDSKLSTSGVVYNWQDDPTNTGNNVYPGGGGYQGIFDAWNGAAFDVTRNRMMFWGGGHSAYAGNEMYAFDFDTNTWSMVVQPDSYRAVTEDMTERCMVIMYDNQTDCETAGLTWAGVEGWCYDQDISGGGAKDACYAKYTEDVEAKFNCHYVGLVSTGNPKTIHTYDGSEYYSQIDSWCHNFGAQGATTCNQGSEFRCYSFTNNEWSRGFTTSAEGGAGMWGEIDPISKIWYGSGVSIAGKPFAKYDAATDTRTHGNDPSTTALNNTANYNFTIDYRRKRGVLINQTNDVIYYVDYEPFVEGSTRLGPNYYTISGDSDWWDEFSSREAGMSYDPVLDKVIMFDSDGADLGVYTLDSVTGVMAALSPTGGPPPEDPGNGVFSRFKYIPLLNKYVYAHSENNEFYLLSLTTLTDVTDVTLNSTSGDTDYPLTIGQGFKQGDVPNAQEVAFRMPDGYVLPTSYECKKTWNDGSCKHAIMSAIVPTLEAGTDFVLDLTTSPDLTDGRDDLSESDIIAAAPTATVAFAGQSWTTVDLGNLLGAPDRTFLAGPDVVEAHYHQDVVEDNEFVVKFYVRYYPTGDTWVRVGIENGILDGTGGTVQTYTPTVTIGGTVVHNTEVAHYGNTRYIVDGWINNSHTDTTIKHDTAYLEASKLVPNYWKTGASESILNGQNQEYTVLEQGQWRTNMADAGFSSQIGLLPNWDALYFSSEGDSRAYNAVIANAKALNTYGIVWRDPSTDMPIVIETGTDWDTWTIGGSGGGGYDSTERDGLTWEVHHHGSGGYLAYLLTGDYYHLETMQYQATRCWLGVWSAYGAGTQRYWKSQPRGLAWVMRTVGQYAAVSPTDAISTDLASWVAYLGTFFNIPDNVGANGIGIWYYWSAGNEYDGQAAVYMHHFSIATFGFLSDLEPLTDMTDIDAIRDDGYRWIVGLLGPGGTGNYCFGYAADNFIYVRDKADPEVIIRESEMYATFGEVWTENCTEGNVTCPDPLTLCPNILTSEGSSSSFPNSATGYWANLLPAIAYAVDDGATGADASYARLTGASNWSDVDTAGYEDTPVWGISPRGEEPPEPGEGTLWGSDGSIWQFQ